MVALLGLRRTMSRSIGKAVLHNVPQGEQPAAIRLFIYCLLTGSSYTLARTAGDSLFLSRMGSDNLAMIFVASGVVTATVASVWFWMAKRYSLERFLQVSTCALGLLTLLAWAFLPVLHHSFYWLGAIYVLAEIKGCVNAINIVSALNETLGGHSSRHSWAKVLAGFPVAALAIGLLIGIETSAVGVGTWLLLAAAFDILAVVPTLRLTRYQAPKLAAKQNQISQVAFLAELSRPLNRYVSHRPFTRWIGVLIAAKVIVLTIIGFEWKVAANHFFDGNEQALAHYFGIFYAALGIITLAVQFFLTGKILTGKSILVPVLLLPVVLLVLNSLIVIGTGVLVLLLITTVAKSMDAWRRSTHDTAIHLLYTSIEKTKRRGLIGRNYAMIKPVSEVFASLILLLGSKTMHESALIIATLVWIVSSVSLLVLVSQSDWANRLESSRVKQLAPRLFHNN